MQLIYPAVFMYCQPEEKFLMKISESFKSYIHINSDEFYAELVWDYEENRKIERIYKKCETK